MSEHWKKGDFAASGGRVRPVYGATENRKGRKQHFPVFVPEAQDAKMQSADTAVPGMPYLLAYAAVEKLIPEMSEGKHSGKARLPFYSGLY